MLTKKPGSYDAGQAVRTQRLAGVPLASFWSRAAALVIDFALAGAIFLGLTGGLIALVKYVPALRDWDANNHVEIELNFFHNWYSVVYLVIFFGLTLWHCVERALGYGASALELGFGFFQYFMHPNRQTVHDRIAETIVVDESAKLS
jgi:uncharacterized RDD family membrane protein YckC